MKYKLYVIATVIALLVAIPVSSALSNKDNLLKIERSQTKELQLKIEREQKTKTEFEQKLQEQIKTNEQIKQENDKLKTEVQAKAERKEAERVALAKQAEQAKKPALSAGGASYAGAGNCEAYRSLVSQYNWNVNTAMKVMQAESTCNAMAHNTTDNHGVCMGSFGLFQISCHSGAVYDPAQNIAIAYQKYQARGWQPWGVCTSGKVSCI